MKIYIKKLKTYYGLEGVKWVIIIEKNKNKTFLGTYTYELARDYFNLFKLYPKFRANFPNDEYLKNAY